MFFLKKISIKCKNSERIVWIIVYQAHCTHLLANPCTQTAVLTFISRFVYSVLHICKNPSPLMPVFIQCMTFIVFPDNTFFSHSLDQLKYVISGAAKVRKSNKAEDFSPTKLPKSLGGRGVHWRAPSHSRDLFFWFYVTLMMEKECGTCQTSPCESSTLALVQSTALWQSQRIAFHCTQWEWSQMAPPGFILLSFIEYFFS